MLILFLFAFLLLLYWRPRSTKNQLWHSTTNSFVPTQRQNSATRSSKKISLQTWASISRTRKSEKWAFLSSVSFFIVRRESTSDLTAIISFFDVSYFGYLWVRPFFFVVLFLMGICHPTFFHQNFQRHRANFFFRISFHTLSHSVNGNRKTIRSILIFLAMKTLKEQGRKL